MGEMAVLTGEPRSSSVIAVRDSELIRLGRAEFERLSTARPRMILELMRVLITRYRDTLRAPRAARLTTLAILPASASVPVREFALDLVRVLRSQGSHVLHVDASRAQAAAHHHHHNGNGDPVAALAAWLHDLELDHDLVVYEAEPGGTTWTTACLRQADTILVVGTDGADPPSALPAALAHARSGTVRPRTELVLLHGRGATPSGTAAWLRDLPMDGHYHITIGNDRDYQPDLLLEPPVAGFRLLQWAAIDALAEIAYRHARERLEHWDRRGDSRR